ncbi:hypothetical protein, partial [Enterococcus faecium]|uniref:hypothetical protein n=1 Tax=Enterococcus faecium TaxID=1352 RepID=UPI0031CD8C71
MDYGEIVVVLFFGGLVYFLGFVFGGWVVVGVCVFVLCGWGGLVGCVVVGGGGLFFFGGGGGG